MAYELLIQNNKTGVTKNYAPVTTGVEYTTNRTGSPGKLTFDMIKGERAHFVEGDMVRFSVDSTPVFVGYIFARSQTQNGEMNVTAYDQLRYLKASESYVFTAASAGDVIRKIAGDFQLDVGTIEDTGYLIPALVKENKECLDIISHVVELTTLNTGKVFIFYDDAGKLTLRESTSLMMPVAIGSKSLLTGFTYKTDIDSDTYNQIKLMRPNEETGQADMYIFRSPDTIKTWGLLQYYDQVDEELNEAQIAHRAETMLLYYNRVLRTLTVESLGIPGVRAGMMLLLKIPELSDAGFNQFVLLEKVTHRFGPSEHTMQLDTKELNLFEGGISWS